ncbi:MAG: preprotein translocase subunit SecG [Rhodothermia bacterium]|nr:preprotein translocase subunit SecG [Rhodothermia bacterium]
MYTLLIVFIALTALFIIAVVLLQSGKGDGLAGVAAAGYTTQLLGSRQAPDVLEKATWVGAGVFILCCILAPLAVNKTDTQRVLQAPTTTTAPASRPTTPPASTPTPPPASTPKPAGN